MRSTHFGIQHEGNMPLSLPLCGMGYRYYRTLELVAIWVHRCVPADSHLSNLDAPKLQQEICSDEIYHE